MSVNLEVKGTLAKLLATEDLIVEHRSVSTASFNVNTRILTLPRWERASSNVIDLLISHEVGHALFTPNEDYRKKSTVPMGFLNVTEDVRIENLMKQKYSGLPKTFYRGYSELYKEDFFSLEGEDVNDMNIADRVNLYFKVGNFVQVTFSDEEMVVVNQCSAARTFDEAIAAAEALYALHQQQKEEQQQCEEDVSTDVDSSKESSDGQEGDDADQEPGETNEDAPQPTEEGDENPGGEQQKQTESEQTDNITGGSSGGNLSDDVKTMDSLNEAIEEMTNPSSFGEPEYVTYPKLDSADYIVDNKEVHSYIQNSWTKQIAYLNELDDNRADDIINSSFVVHRKKYGKFKKDIQSEVNYMVKEFECKKSASAYSRASTSRTGVLDCTKLHTYKYNEDLFKKVTTLPEGKNHGLLFVLDWSGSMCDILEDTMKQLISLVMFCDKVGIPFDVYAFTNEWYRTGRQVSGDDQENTFHIGSEFALMNVLTSKTNRKELHRQLETMFMIASSYSGRSYDIVPSRVGLSGTPLNEALIVIRDILPKFKKNNNVEKAHVMVLTDGEAACARVNKSITDWTGEPVIRPQRILGSYHYLRNRNTGTVTKIDIRSSASLTTSIISDLCVEFPESTFTGFRVLESRGGWFIRQATGYDDEIQAKWRKEKSIALTNFGYHKYYIVSTNTLQESSEFSVAEDASKAKIKSAFAKSLKTKKSNKKILGDFIGLIA